MFYCGYLPNNVNGPTSIGTWIKCQAHLEQLSSDGKRQGRSVPRRLNLSNIEEVSESRSPSSHEPFTVKSPNSTPVPPARPGRRIPVSIVELEDNFSEPKIHTKSPRVQSPAVRTPSAQSPRVQSPAVRTSYTQSIHVQSPAAGATYAHSLSVQTPSLGKPYVQSSRTPGHPQDMPSFSWSKYTSPKPPTPPKYPTAARELFPETQETYCQTRSPFPLPTEKTPRYQFSNPPMTTQCIAASPRSRLTTPRTQPHVPTSGTSTRRAIPIKVQEIPITPFHASSRAPVTSKEKTEAVDEIIRKYQSSKDKSTKITAAPMERPYDKRAQEIMDILKRHRRDVMVTPSSAGPLRSTSIQRIVERYATPASVYTNTVDNLRHYEDDGGEASGDLEVTEEEELYEEEYGVCGEEGDFDNGQKESAIKRFDLSVRAELKRRKDDPDHILDILVESPFSTRHEEGIGGPFGQALRSSMSTIDIQRSMNYERDSQFIEAVDKLIQAEQASRFQGAVRAAEAAAAAAPPELAEEAAAAGAREYQTDLVETICRKLPGERPIQLVGYIGVTHPRK